MFLERMRGEALRQGMRQGMEYQDIYDVWIGYCLMNGKHAIIWSEQPLYRVVGLSTEPVFYRNRGEVEAWDFHLAI